MEHKTWRRHNGGPCPVDAKAEVAIRFRNGREHGASLAGQWRWQAWPDGPCEWDIVAWRPGEEQG